MPTNFPTSLDTTTNLPTTIADATTQATNHPSYHNTEDGALIALETKLGIGASTATNGLVLTGGATPGTSSWVAIPAVTPSIHERDFESFGGAPGNSVAAQLTAWTAAVTFLRANPGTVIQFGPFVYTNMPQIVLPYRCGIKGDGMMATTLLAKASLNADFVRNETAAESVSGLYPGKFLSIKDMCLDGNKANQTSGRGIVFTEPNPLSNNPDDPDTHNLVENVRVRNVKQDGYAGTGASENRLINVYVDYADGNGFRPGFDTWIIVCTTSQCGLAGIFSTAPSMRIVGCKNFYAGNITASSGIGITMQSQSGGTQQATGCESQDCRAWGFQTNTVKNCMIIGTADSNGWSSAGTYGALDMWASQYCTISIVAMDRQTGDHNGGTPTSYQLNAIQVRSSSLYNQIRITHYGVGTVNAPIMTWEATSTPNEVSINGSGGQQHIALATGTLTPVFTNGGSLVDDTALTGALTIAAPTTGTFWPGMRCRFHLSQDAVGGRVLTWNATYHLAGGTALPTTLSKRNIIDFEYDATAGFWVETSRSAGIA